MIAVLLAAGAHRNRRLWYVLIPAILIHLVWLLIKTTLGFSQSEGQMIGQIFIPLYITIALFFALAQRLSHRKRVVSFFSALLVIGLVGLASFFTYNFGSTEISQSQQLELAFSLIMGTAFLIGFTVAAFVSRNRLTRLKLVAGLFVFAFLFTVVMIFLYGLYDLGTSDFEDVMEVTVVGLMFGLLLCGVSLPFMILAFASPFYRQILDRLSHLPSTPPKSTDSASEQA